MSLGKLGSFFKSLAQIGPFLLRFTPLAPIADEVMAAIQEAEAIFGPGTGAEKLAHVVAAAVEAAKIANEAAGRVVVDPAQVGAVATAVVSAIITVLNALHPKA
jgi:hypothetical protein